LGRGRADAAESSGGAVAFVRRNGGQRDTTGVGVDAMMSIATTDEAGGRGVVNTDAGRPSLVAGGLVETGGQRGAREKATVKAGVAQDDRQREGRGQPQKSLEQRKDVAVRRNLAHKKPTSPAHHGGETPRRWVMREDPRGTAVSLMEMREEIKTRQRLVAGVVAERVRGGLAVRAVTLQIAG